ncbi:MAG: acyl-CoA dehydrogenase family protein [Leptospiraceae bacterium]|nr:acyl-CoA dehydrogenase family protein [Leptospiraceae bacterium]
MQYIENSKTNPALLPFDITGYTGNRGKNFYKEDTILKRIIVNSFSNLKIEFQQAVENHLSNYGKLIGETIDPLVDACHKEGKYGEIIKYDNTGNRIDEVRYSPEQLEVRKRIYEYGIINLDFHPNWKHPFTFLHKMSLAYLTNMCGEAGVTCPAAMTDGMIQALKSLGTEEQKKKYLPIVAGYGSSSHFMAGQYVTERVGGSNVSAGRTIARKKENGKWALTGEKWFCSNPGDLWVTSAKIENTNTIGLFLVSRLKDNGELNNHHILRKKDIIGSKGKITVEIVYDEVEAEELGRTSHGIANLIKFVIKVSRIHVSIASLGFSRRGFMEAFEYTKMREAYGKKIIQFGSVLRSLTEMKILHTILTYSVFKNYSYIENSENIELLLTPLLKYISTTHSTWLLHEAIILHGGNGILGDFSPLPRLLNDSIINETWEGTHHIITDHALHAFQRPKVKESFWKELNSNISGLEKEEDLKNPLVVFNEKKIELEEALKNSKDWIEMNRLPICDLIYSLFSISEIIRQVKECENKETKEIHTYIANGYAEIIQRGRLNQTNPNGIFSDKIKMEKIVYY